jgi:hypothetical protein
MLKSILLFATEAGIYGTFLELMFTFEDWDYGVEGGGDCKVNG